MIDLLFGSQCYVSDIKLISKIFYVFTIYFYIYNYIYIIMSCHTGGNSTPHELIENVLKKYSDIL